MHGHPRGRPGRYQLDSIRRLSQGGGHVDSLSVLVLRASFSDLAFKDGPEYDEPHDSLYYANELRHLDEYYHGASGARFTLGRDFAAGLVELGRPMAYYGEDGLWEERVAEMLMEVVEETDSLIDFSQYEAFAIIHAGAGQETDFNGDSPEQLWSGFIDPSEMAEVLADTLGTPGVPTNDSIGGEPFYIDNLMVWPEEASQDGMIFGSLGIYAYQVGFRIGMIPLFDTTPSGFPDSQGIGSFGLMGYGLYNAAGFIPAFPCAFHRYLMGWAEPVEVSQDGSLRLADINTAAPPETALVRIQLSEGEYLLIANRVHDTDFDGLFDFVDLNGNGIPENEDTLRGAEFDFFLTATTNPSVEEDQVKRVITGSGLMIWHIDERIILEQLAIGRYPNDNAGRKGVDLEEADGVQDLDSPIGSYSFGSYLDSFRESNNTRFGPETIPSSRGNGGTNTGVTIDGISAAAPVMSCSVSFDLPFANARAEFSGDAGDFSPIPVGLKGDALACVSVVHDTNAADTGLVHIVRNTEADTLSVELLLEVPGAAWTAPPVFADVDADYAYEMFLSSDDGSLHAYELDGSPYPIDTDASPGVLALRDSLVTAPMAVEADGDQWSEVLVLASTRDSTFAYIVGSSIAPPGSDWTGIGNGVYETGLLEGYVISHTAEGLVWGAAGRWDGFFCMTAEGDGTAGVHFIRLLEGDLSPAEILILSRQIGGVDEPDHLLTIAAGDIDGDVVDEMVAAIPGTGVVYCNPLRGIRTKPLGKEVLSSPVLGDIDGDGVLETALRDETRFHLLTGFGVTATNWPVRIPAAAVSNEGPTRPAPPIIGDVDGSGDLDVLFVAGGDLYAYTHRGGQLREFPLPGEGCGPRSAALLPDSDNMLSLFATGSAAPIGTGGGAPGLDFDTNRSSIRRYDLSVRASYAQTWFSYRRDAGGSSNQASGSPSGEPGAPIDGESFICYPNPATGGRVTVRIAISGLADVHLVIMNLEGERVAERRCRHDLGWGSAVPFEAEFATADLSSGIYICHLEIQGNGWSWKGTKKFAVIK